MHCYGERIVTFMFLHIYMSLASIVILQPRWICRSVASSFFSFSFFSNLSPFAGSKSVVRFFASPVSGIIQNFFSKNLPVFFHLLRYNINVDGGKWKRHESYPGWREIRWEILGEKFRELFVLELFGMENIQRSSNVREGILIRIILKIVLRAEEFGNISCFNLFEKVIPRDTIIIIASCNSILLLANTLDSPLERKITMYKNVENNVYYIYPRISVEPRKWILFEYDILRWKMKF